MEEATLAGFRLIPRLSAVKSVELQWRNRRRNPFSAQAHRNHINFYLRRPILNEHPQLFAAAAREFGPVKSNHRDEYRTHLRTRADVDRMLMFLRKQRAWPDR
jgi:hypothetical protein